VALVVFHNRPKVLHKGKDRKKNRKRWPPKGERRKREKRNRGSCLGNMLKGEGRGVVVY